MNDTFEDELLSESVGLFILRQRIQSCLEDGAMRSELVEQELIDIDEAIRDALDLNDKFEKEQDMDLKHEIGFAYSEITDEIKQKLETLQPYNSNILHLQ